MARAYRLVFAIIHQQDYLVLIVINCHLSDRGQQFCIVCLAQHSKYYLFCFGYNWLYQAACVFNQYKFAIAVSLALC